VFTGSIVEGGGVARRLRSCKGIPVSGSISRRERNCIEDVSNSWRGWASVARWSWLKVDEYGCQSWLRCIPASSGAVIVIAAP